MIISAILSLRYNIPRRASRILNPTLNLLIKSSISRSGGPPTPAFHIPQDLSTIFEHLQLKPVIQNYIGCPQSFFLKGLIESVTTDQPHCQCHNDPNDHDPPCAQSLGKFIYSFEPHTQNTTNMKQTSLPTSHFLYQQVKNWLARFLQQAVIMEILPQHQHSQTPEGSPKCDVWMDWSGDASLALEISMTPHSCPFLVHWPSPFMCTGLMHMESQPGWPVLDLSCSFVLISPQVKN
ncbi:hypothetical protein O181_070339 [Austropuccinia psidii MF-1]|uniref:Uncharacterized protein n=1 Tax=Austropuccinia psidii MF-1 TaxID=1389203 RepID=A0A9Q3F0M3_9BASI|nr:hypothetical protein [Austropuccinia psidii MF-1]